MQLFHNDIDCTIIEKAASKPTPAPASAQRFSATSRDGYKQL